MFDILKILLFIAYEYPAVLLAIIVSIHLFFKWLFAEYPDD